MWSAWCRCRLQGLPPCKDVHTKINPFLCTKPCLNTFRRVSGLASPVLCPFLPCFTPPLLLWGPQQAKGGGEGWLPAAVLACLASCLSLPGMLLPAGAQPASIKLSQALLSSAELSLCSCRWVWCSGVSWGSSVGHCLSLASILLQLDYLERWFC